MSIELIKAEENDLGLIHHMQVSAFKSLLDKYQDYDTNPAAEPLERIIERYNQDITTYFLILFKEQYVGAIRFMFDGSTKTARISPIFVIPEYQGKKIGQMAIEKLENMFSDTVMWELDTILQEEKLCYLYEKLGYLDTGKRETIKDGMDIVFYKKMTNLNSA